MARSRHLLPLVGFLVCLAAVFSYPTFFVKFPATRDVPWASWLVFAVGFFLVGRGMLRGSRVTGSLFAVASVAALVFFVFMTEIWSRQLPPSSGAPRVGEKAPDFSLAAAGGGTVRLSDVGAWSLLNSRPAEFLVDPSGTVRWLDLTEDYWVRARPETVLAAFDRLPRS